MHIKLLNLDNSLITQPALKHAERIEAQDLAHSTRIFAHKSTVKRLIQRIGEPKNQPEIIFYGSGDFHHLSAAFISRYTQLLTIIHFDNHPDWVTWPATHNCGAWVNRALDMQHVKRIITLGVSSNDLENPDRKHANLEAFNNGTLKLYPWFHLPSKTRDGKIQWQNLCDVNWPDFIQGLKIPTETIYITIDKDVLSTAEATTNWDQSAMPLSHITSAITMLSKRFKICGIDVCGDYSTPRFKDPFRWALAYFDHPKRFNPTQEQLAINAKTNQKLVECFESLRA